MESSMTTPRGNRPAACTNLTSSWIGACAALVLIAATAVLAGAASPTPNNVVQPARSSLCVLFHGGVHGQIADCGCKMKPLGGLARRAALIESLSSGRDDVVLVDAGGLFGQDDPASLEQTRFLVEQTATLGYDAIGVGMGDLGLGVDFLRQAASEHGLPYTSANVLLGGKPMFQPYRIVVRQGVRVGLISVLAAGAAVGRTLPAGIDLADAQATLTRVVPELRQKVDVIILLAHTKLNGLDELLQGLPKQAAVDLAIDGSSAQPLYETRALGSTLVACANARGKYLGQLDLVVAPAGGITQTAFDLHELKLELPEDRRLAKLVSEFKSEHDTVAQNR